MERKTYLGRYRVSVDLSGLPVELRGTSASVTYKGEDSLQAREVAVEVVPIGGLRPAVVQQLEAEAVAARQLHHINIPALHEFGVDRDELIYVTEYFDGTTAEDWVRSHGALPTGTMLRIALQAVSALGAAAFHNIFHHAFSPRNLMLVPGQTPQGDWPLIKVLNFIGLAPAQSSAETAALDPADAIHYASPEQHESGMVDFRSEIYSLGSTLWFLLTGLPAAGAATVEAGNMFAPVKRLLVKMLAADPAQRPLDPLALQEEIQECIAHLDRLQSVASKFGLAAPLAAAPIQAAPVAPRVRRRLPMKPLALAALLLLLVGLGAVMLPARFRSHEVSDMRDEDAIGVPVGIPESAAPATVATNNSVVPRDETSADVTQSAPAIVSADPPVLTSTPDASVDQSDASSEANEEPAQVAANSSPVEAEMAQPEPSVPAVRESAPVIAKNSLVIAQAEEEPEPPTEGPDDNAESVPPAETPEASAPMDDESKSVATDSASALSGQETRRPPAILIPKEREVKITRAPAAIASKPAPAKTRVASNSQPPIPRGSVRAQFLGTTPDGNLVFGLPGAQKGYVAPDGAREGSSRRRVRRALPVDALPVLPALPPDQ